MNGNTDLENTATNWRMKEADTVFGNLLSLRLPAGATKRIGLAVLVLLLTGFLHTTFSQTIYIKATIDRNSILIGEPIKLQLEASVPHNTPFVWFTGDSLPHFELVEKSKIDTAPKADHNIYRQVITLTSFDSGSWVVPALPLEANNKFYLTDSLPVTVSFSDFNPTQDYHDIKDIVEVETVETSYINWIIAIVTLLALLGLIYFLRKRKKKPAAPAAPPPLARSPIEEALFLLEELRARRLPEQGEAKLYYTALTDIFRSFILRKMKVATLQKTSEEMILQLRRMELPPEQFTQVAQTLRMSDAVKFAKYVPPANENDESFDHIKRSIELINNLHP